MAGVWVLELARLSRDLVSIAYWLSDLEKMCSITDSL